MASLTITLTDDELKALKTIAESPTELVENFAKNRARIAIKGIKDSLYAHCNNNDIAIEVGESSQIAQAFTLKLVDEVANIGYTLPGDKEE